MSKASPAAVNALLRAIEPACKARSMERFSELIKAGTTAIQGMQKSESGAISAITTVITGQGCSLRMKNIAEMCAWPLFDNPEIPCSSEGTPEYLKLFCIPVVVQFEGQALRKPLSLPDKLFDPIAFSEALSAAKYFHQNMGLLCSGTVLTRGDIQRVGPEKLSADLINESQGVGLSTRTPRTLEFNPDLECGRVATFYVVAAARANEPATSLPLMPGPGYPDAISRIILAALTEQGVAVEKVTSFPPTTMAESILRSTPSGRFELKSILDLANAEYALDGISLDVSTGTFAEIQALIKNEQDNLIVAPAIEFVEPASVMIDLVKRCCIESAISFKGLDAEVAPMSATLH